MTQATIWRQHSSDNCTLITITDCMVQSIYCPVSPELALNVRPLFRRLYCGYDLSLCIVCRQYCFGYFFEHSEPFPFFFAFIHQALLWGPQRLWYILVVTALYSRGWVIGHGISADTILSISTGFMYVLKAKKNYTLTGWPCFNR